MHNYGMTKLARRWIEQALKEADRPHLGGFRHNAEPIPEREREHHARVDWLVARAKQPR